MNSKTLSILSVIILSIFCNDVSAHDVFKDPMMKRFQLKSVSCSACHLGREKSDRNKFGALFAKSLKDKNLTAGLKAAKANGKKAAEDFEAVMVKEFVLALKQIEKSEPLMMKIVDAGLLVGTKKNADTLPKLKEEVNEFLESKADTPLFESK